MRLFLNAILNKHVYLENCKRLNGVAVHFLKTVVQKKKHEGMFTKLENMQPFDISLRIT